MTAKPKPRKGASKVPPVKPAPAGTPNNCSEINKLLARYRFLEADQRHNAAIAETAEESGDAWSAHNKELDRIRDKLASIVPETFSGARDLLLFVLEEVRTCGGLHSDETELQIVENVADSLWRIRNNFAEAVRNAAYDLMLSKMADVSKAAKAIEPFSYGDALNAVMML
jgi:hypothetical protein